MSGRPCRLLGLLVTTLATIAVSANVAPVAASSGSSSVVVRAEQPKGTVVASGLRNPRGLSFDRRGRLFVAEAGSGGVGPCMPGPEGVDVCFGRSGSVSIVDEDGARRVAKRFPSLAERNGGAAIGPTDVVVDRNGRYQVSIGLGLDPSTRNGLPRSGRRLMGTLTVSSLGGGPRHVLADLARYEATHDPDGAGPDSNPVGFIRRGRGFVAVDAGGNDLLKVTRGGKVSTRAVFESRKVPNPFGGPDLDMQAVPTSVASGPRGVLYVSQLTGFPFPAGEAQIFRVRRDGRISVHASGLTNVTDLAWHRGHLYAVQIADHGLRDATGIPMGSLVRIERDGSKTTVLGDLRAPYGVAVRRGSAYVTTCSVCVGSGQVVKVSLAR